MMTSGDFRLANCLREFRALMGWVRRRLRSIQLKPWKTPKKLPRRLRQLNYQSVYFRLKMASWRSSSSPQSHRSMCNAWFHNRGGVVRYVKGIPD